MRFFLFLVENRFINPLNFQRNARLDAVKFEKKYYNDYFKHLNPDDYQNATIKRQLLRLRKLGINALPDKKIEQVCINVYLKRFLISQEIIFSVWRGRWKYDKHLRTR